MKNENRPLVNVRIANEMVHGWPSRHSVSGYRLRRREIVTTPNQIPAEV